MPSKNRKKLAALPASYPVTKPGEHLDMSDLRVCVDRYLPEDQVVLFAKLAVQENPFNKPSTVGVRAFSGPTPLSMALVTAKKWQNGRTLRCAFLDGTQAQRELVRRVAPQWSQYANINFDFGSTPDVAEIRVSFMQQGAWAYIGTDALGIPRDQCTVNFGFIDEATVLHEFGHVLGCIHEHQHPEAGIPWNKPVVYQYYGGPPNNWSRQLVDTNIFERYSRDITQFSVYDKSSIMHYPVDPRLTDGRFTVGWNRMLSQADKTFIAQAYPRDSSVNPVISAVTLPTTGTYAIAEVNGKKVMTFN